MMLSLKLCLPTEICYSIVILNNYNKRCVRKLDIIRIHLLKSFQGNIYISSILLENVETKTFHLKSNAI